MSTKSLEEENLALKKIIAQYETKMKKQEEDHVRPVFERVPRSLIATPGAFDVKVHDRGATFPGLAIPIDILQWKTQVEAQLKQLDDLRKCPICFVNEKSHRLSCGHLFCQNCIDQFQQSICPTCRMPFVANQVSSIYL
eukprot:c9328_g1_i3.p1 GENE.c9328_g1_i3~~c9328_g1_i3.p1  ORF type:complete len:151 (+),score=28.89 c9328_g1_i3:38-454(+)